MTKIVRTWGSLDGPPYDCDEIIVFLPTLRLPCDALCPRHRARYSSCNNSSKGKRPVSGIHGCTFHHSSCSVILIVTLDALLT